jgi:hypothetical protein
MTHRHTPEAIIPQIRSGKELAKNFKTGGRFPAKAGFSPRHRSKSGYSHLISRDPLLEVKVDGTSY